ncbi:FAD/FMN-dependent dehydrogenase [Burkholderiales bacterium JOSHI_001]|nr:FAD/FMN-dependent dehydrogenase [Burkholderiales bacterium JOSHI_001]
MTAPRPDAPIEVGRAAPVGGLAPAALEALRAAVGAAHVCADPGDLDRYSRCTIPWQSRCAAVVFPGSTQEVAGVLAVANVHGLKVWPFSGGRNWGYSTTLATEDGAIVMLLHRMNRVLEVNEELAYAVIEPGVTYEQLNDHLKRHGHRLWVDCIDGTSQGSVIGNALDRGVGETPYGDHFGNLCGMEVVLPQGQIVEVGGGTNGPKTKHLHKWGIGPYLEGMFSQSNFGVVTRAGIWLMPEPEAYNSYVFEVGEERHLPQVIDTFRDLALQGIVNTKLHMINDLVSLTVVMQRIEQADPKGAYLQPAEVDALRRRFGISPMTCAGGLYGTRAQVRLQRAILKKALGRYGRLLFISDAMLAVVERVLKTAWERPLLRWVTEKLSGASLQVLDSSPHVHKILRGVPTDYFVKHAYYRNRRKRPDGDIDPARDNCGVIWFAPTLPFTSKDVLPFLQRARTHFEHAGLDFWVAILVMNPRAVTCLMNILYDRDDADETQRARQLYDALHADMTDSGYQQYRASMLAWDRVFENAPQALHLNNRIKSALDPNGVVAPGRYGIG